MINKDPGNDAIAKHQLKARALIYFSIAMIACVFSFKRIPQDISYHLFADKRELIGMPNFWNVVSNFPFLIMGVFGLMRTTCLDNTKNKLAYTVLCLGFFLIGLGSAYYHYVPSTSSLVWDRLPMTIGFMALFSMLLEERVFKNFKIRSLWPLLIMGIASVVYWAWSESQNTGDLRPYILVQFMPIILIPLILILFKEVYLKNHFLILSFAFYVGAKICEHYDWQVQEILGVLSGHTIKHFLASLAVLFIILSVPNKKTEEELINKF